MNRHTRWLLFFSIVFLFSSELRAAMAYKMSTQELVRESDAVLIGRCTDLQGTWIGRELVTLATIAVEATLKGKSRESLTVVLPGGSDTKGPIPLAMTVDGAPTLGVGEEVFLFLREIPQMPGSFTIAGFSQGKYSIRENENKRKLVSRSLNGLMLKSRDGVEKGTSTELSLAAFEKSIRELIRSEKASAEPLQPVPEKEIAAQRQDVPASDP